MTFDDKVNFVMRDLKSYGWYWEDEEELYLVLAKYFNEGKGSIESFERAKREKRKEELLKELKSLEDAENYK